MGSFSSVVKTLLIIFKPNLRVFELVPKAIKITQHVRVA
jgi:hypothetical protein